MSLCMLGVGQLHTLRQLLQLHRLRQRGQPQSLSLDTCGQAELHIHAQSYVERTSRTVHAS